MNCIKFVNFRGKFVPDGGSVRTNAIRSKKAENPAKKEGLPLHKPSYGILLEIQYIDHFAVENPSVRHEAERFIERFCGAVFRLEADKDARVLLVR